MKVLWFFIYASIFKVSLIACGGLCIYLGYRLLKTSHDSDPNMPTTVKADLGKGIISLKTATPGAIFAVFGGLILGLMLFMDSPEMILTSSNSISNENSEAQNEKPQTSEFYRNMSIDWLTNELQELDHGSITEDSFVQDLRARMSENNAKK